MKNPKNSINRKLKKIRKNVELLSRTLATKKGTATLKRGLDFTRNDLDQKFRRLAVEITKNSCDIGDLKKLSHSLEEVRENVWLLVNKMDALSRHFELTQKAV